MEKMGSDIQRKFFRDLFVFWNWREPRASSCMRLKHAHMSGRKSEGREGNRGFKLGYSETLIYVHLYLEIRRDLRTEGKADANWGLEISFQGSRKGGYEGMVQK